MTKHYHCTEWLWVTAIMSQHAICCEPVTSKHRPFHSPICLPLGLCKGTCRWGLKKRWEFSLLTRAHNGIGHKQCQITMPTKPCIGPAASLYRERFDLPRHHGMSVLTFSGSRGSEGTLVKQQSSHFDPLWYTTQGMLLIYPGCWYLVLLEPL